MSGLSELIAKLEGLSGPDREVDAAICVTLQYGGKNSEHAANVRTDHDWEGDLLFDVGNMDCCNPIPELTASLDAAVALIERKLPGAKVIACTATKLTNGTYQADYAIKYDGDPASLNDMKVAWGAKAEGPDLASTMARACILALLRSLEGRDE